MFWFLLIAVCPLLTKGLAVKQADCLEISTTLCGKMSNHLLEALGQYKKCMEHREIRFSSFNGGECPPPCMVKSFSKKCVVRVSGTGTDPIGLLTWTNFEQMINATVDGDGNCPMLFVLNKIDDIIGELKNWLQVFCTCIDCKLRKLFKEGGCLNVEKLRRIIEECFDAAQKICPQTVLIRRLFVEAYLRFLTSNVNFECCLDKRCTDHTVADTTPRLTTSPPACSSNPCLNGGRCHNTKSGFYCQCYGGFVGPTCNIRITTTPIPTTPTSATAPNFCAINRCQNGGICFSGSWGYSCSCRPGFTGRHCEHSMYTTGTPVRPETTTY